MILYILALGSPTHAVPESAWDQWTSRYSWQTHYGYSYVNFPPLFGHQYSHCWVDFRNIQDDYMRNRGITYFENSRRATLAQQAFADANPFGWAGYSDSLWGFTASDVPTGYSARGAPPPQSDDGTITPTAPVSSLPFAPDEVLLTIHNMWNSYGPQLWTPYGFRDAFNLTFNWWGPDVIGIDQGPQVLMIENYRTGRVWNRFMENPHVQTGLTRAGFLTATTRVAEKPPNDEVGFALLPTPNPVTGATSIQFRIPASGQIRLAVFDVRGREVSVLMEEYQSAGTHSAQLEVSGLKAGVYFYQLEFAGRSRTKQFVYLR